MAARAQGNANGIGRHVRAALAGGILLLNAGAARAQYVYEDEILSPRAVTWRLSDRGFSGFTRPRFDGRDYVVEAFAPNGVRVRLFVDARDGAILGRQRLDPAPVARLVRPAPGYGWTEADARLVPPADIPQPGGRIVPPRPELYGRAEAAPLPRREQPDAHALGANPQGVNPDAKTRPEPQRRSARLASPPAGAQRPGETRPAVRTAPEAPQPSLTPAEAQRDGSRETAKAAAKPQDQAKPSEVKAPEGRETPVAAVEPPKAAPAAQTPAAVQPPPKEAAETAQAVKPAEPKAAEGRAAEAEQKPGTTGWQDPPPEGKRNVRVIGGATVVTRPSAEGGSTD
ncbi:hypothetical protein U8607_00355 [Methylobacterium durans]|uniref:hypothetical protein n=1 Tax=Methylobacterium durans TaxID=2202825 RepID=UPI002AFEE729|nr:hypothetical protein [Methylobacterium durans]MEA1830518.1 hypothetical protein [Methylobacterium durans]